MKRITNRDMRELQKSVVKDLVTTANVLRVVVNALEKHNILKLEPGQDGVNISIVEPSRIIDPFSGK